MNESIKYYSKVNKLKKRSGSNYVIIGIAVAATLEGGFFIGVLIGYALKKVIKLVAIIVGLFLARLAYLQYHQIANINWSKLQTV